MQLDKYTHEWLRWMLITSIPLRHLGEDDMPLGIASGCLVICKSRRFIVSVSHAVKPGSTGWAIQLGDDQLNGTEVYRLTEFQYLQKMPSGADGPEYLDLCFAEVSIDLQPLYARRERGSISDARPYQIFKMSDFAEPAQNGVFAFAGEVRPEMHGINVLATEMNVYPGLHFLRSDGVNCVFQLPVEHPGHESFKGCSGAPIIDMERRVVAIVNCGDEKAGTINGIGISIVERALNYYCDIRDFA